MGSWVGGEDSLQVSNWRTGVGEAAAGRLGKVAAGRAGSPTFARG